MSTKAALWTWTPLKLPADLWKFILFPFQAILPFKERFKSCWNSISSASLPYCWIFAPPNSSSDCCSKTRPTRALIAWNCNHCHSFGQQKICKKRLFLQQETTKNKECSCECFPPAIYCSEAAPRYLHPRTSHLLLLDDMFGENYPNERYTKGTPNFINWPLNSCLPFLQTDIYIHPVNSLLCITI